MSESTVVGVPRDGTITLTNGDAANYVVSYENGDFSYSEDRAERVVIYDRGTIVGLRSSNDAVPTFSFTIHFREFMNAAAATLLDFIYKTNNQSGATSSGGTGFEPFLVDVEFKADMSSLSGSNTKVTLTKCLLVASFSEGSPDSVSISGECYGAVTRAAG